MSKLTALPIESFDNYHSITAGQVEDYRSEGYDLNTQESKNGYTLLIMTAWHGNHEAVKALVECEVDLDTADELGETALISAITKKHYKIAKLLCTSGANPFIRDNKGQTALDILLKQDEKKYGIISTLEKAMQNYKRFTLQSENSVSSSRFYKSNRTSVTTTYDFSTEDVITETALVGQKPSFNIRSFNEVAGARSLEKAHEALIELGGKTPNDKDKPARLTVRTKRPAVF